jgi:hypothetical protein
MKYWAIMEILTVESTDGFSVASFVESREEDIDVGRVRLIAIRHRLDQLFNQDTHRDLSSVCNTLSTPISVIIDFHDYLFHTIKLTAKSGRVKVRDNWSGSEYDPHGFHGYSIKSATLGPYFNGFERFEDCSIEFFPRKRRI